MKYVPNAVSTKVARSLLIGKKHSPTLLFIGGVGLGVATVITACRATLQLEDVLAETKQNIDDANEILGDDSTPRRKAYDKQAYNKDLAYIYIRAGVRMGRLYGPSIVMGVASIAMLTGAHRIQNARIAGLSAAYKALDLGFREYRGRVASEFGEEKERELRYDAQEKTVVVEDKNGPKKVKKKVAGHGALGSPYARVWDETTSRYWQAHPHDRKVFIQCQQAYANERLRAKGHVFLNEVHDLLGLERTKSGQMVGWVVTDKSGDGFIDFGLMDPAKNPEVFAFMFDGAPGVVLDFNVDGVILDKI